jgi:uncharacterized protein (DUF1501 family)
MGWSMGRRDFLAVSGGILVGLGALAGCGKPTVARADAPQAGTAGAAAPSGTGRTLVVIYLGGGNDGLNTVAPYGMGEYYDLRPTLAIEESEALLLVGKMGLHPHLKGFKALYDAGKLTVLQGVGYPEPDRSHFRSFDIWATAQTKGVSPVGWLGRYLDLTGAAQAEANPLRAVAVGAGVPKPLIGAAGSAIAVETLEAMQVKGSEPVVQAIRAMYALGDGPLAVVRGKGQVANRAADAVQRLAGGYASGVAYPKSQLAASLQLMVKLVAGGAGTEVLYTTLGGFDEHANEKANHDRLMLELDEAVAAFQQDLEANGLADRVVTFIHSEFGRRARENGSGGTDHGAAGPSFLVGTRVQGGIVGEHPSLAELLEGDLRMGIDFRSIYTTLLDGWLRGYAAETLGSRFEQLPLLRR